MDLEMRCFDEGTLFTAVSERASNWFDRELAIGLRQVYFTGNPNLFLRRLPADWIIKPPADDKRTLN